MYTKLKVIQSAAGYYIGRGWVEDGFEEPGSRESGYFGTEGQAMKALETGFEVRDCAENNAAYDKGELPDIRKESVCRCGAADCLGMTELDIGEQESLEDEEE